MHRRFRVAALVVALCPAAAHAAWVVKPGSVSPLLGRTTDRGRAASTTRRRIVVGLALRNRDDLDAFLADVHDPRSPRYGRFLTQEEFNALYAPTPAEEASLVDHLRASGLAVTDRYPNRLVVGATGTVAAMERAFGVAIHVVEHRGLRHFAAMNDPSFPGELAASVTGVIGLDDLVERRPRVAAVEPAASLGTNCCALAPADLALFYDNATGHDGSGETIVIAGAYAWKDTDNTAFATQWGLPALPAGSGQVCTGPAGSSGCKFSNSNSIEVALDAEYSHASAPGARILNYMAASTSNADFTQLYNRIVTDNPGHVVTTSWGACEAGLPVATQQTDDAIFANANAIGQSWFAASGDNGSLDCNQLLTVDNPANSPHVIGVGGTTPTCSGGMTAGNPGCGGYGSETGWSGSGGGVSQVFTRPAFQAGCGVPVGTQRLVPDVALEADTTPGNYVVKNGGWFIVGGTSGAAPQWAGYLAELDQKAGGTGFGNPGALLYGLCGTMAFHDVTSGSNGDYAAGAAYDLVTGLGTPRVATLAALAVPSTPTTTTTSSTTTVTTTSTVSTTTTTSSTTTTVSTTTTSSSTTSSTTTTVTTSTSSSTTSSTSTSTVPTTTTSSSTTSSTTTSSTTSSTTSTSSTTTTATTSTTSSTTSSTTVPTTTTSSSTSSSTTTSSTTSSTTSTSSTTASTSSTTTVPATTSTIATTTSTSTTTLPTTTTTLPAGCPDDGFAGLRCVLAPGLHPTPCAGVTPTAKLRRRFAHAVHLVDRAEAARTPRKARRRIARAAHWLARSRRAVEDAGVRLSAGCGAALGEMLDDAARRAEQLATTI